MISSSHRAAWPRLAAVVLVTFALDSALAASTEPTSPDELMRTVSRTEYKLARDPQAAVACIVNNITASKLNLGITIERIPAGARVLVTFGVFVAAVVQVVPEGSGTAATIWASRSPVYQREQLIPTMIKGC